MAHTGFNTHLSDVMSVAHVTTNNLHQVLTITCNRSKVFCRKLLELGVTTRHARTNPLCMEQQQLLQLQRLS